VKQQAEQGDPKAACLIKRTATRLKIEPWREDGSYQRDTSVELPDVKLLNCGFDLIIVRLAAGLKSSQISSLVA
jgi:hypothetical protein